jgi:hypothetical protein
MVAAAAGVTAGRATQAVVETLSLPILPASRVTQAVTEILAGVVSSTAEGRVTQALVEILQASTGTRITQAVVELLQPVPITRVTQAVVELLTPSAAIPVRVTQLAVDVFSPVTVATAATQLAVEVFRARTPLARATQLVTEVFLVRGPCVPTAGSLPLGAGTTDRTGGRRRSRRAARASILFADDFNAGVLTGWGSPNNLPTVNQWGHDRTYCVGCWTGQSRKILTPVVPSVGAIRAQVACILTATDALDGALAFSVQDFNGGDNVNRYQLLVYLKPNGAFRIRYKLVPPTVAFADTAPSLFPVDGTQFGLQIRFSIGAPHTVVFTVNDVDVATLSWTYAYDANQWDDVWVYAIYGNTAGGPPLTQVGTVDNYEVDSSNAKVAWPAGTAPRLDVTRTCFLPPPDPEPPAAGGSCPAGLLP